VRRKSRYARTFKLFLLPLSPSFHNIQLQLRISILRSNNPIRGFTSSKHSFRDQLSLNYHLSGLLSHRLSNRPSDPFLFLIESFSQHSHTHRNQSSCRQDVCPEMEQSCKSCSFNHFGPPPQLHRVRPTIPRQASMFPDWRVLCRWNVPPAERSRNTFDTGRWYKGQ
jgi:hypothetical protein